MGYMFVLVMVIGMVYYGVQAIKDSIDHQREIDREYQRAYDIFKQYPHLLRKRLKDMYLEVNENSDSAEEIRVKIANNKAVRTFLQKLEDTQSRNEFIVLWKEIIDYDFFYLGSLFRVPRHIELSNLEYDMEHDNIAQEETRMIETQEKKKLKDEYSEWF